MFLVYRVDSDGCTFSSDSPLFVTADEQTAKDAVALALLEKDEALKLPRPCWNVTPETVDAYVKLTEQYKNDFCAIFTVDVPTEITDFHVDSETWYDYSPIEVR